MGNHLDADAEKPQGFPAFCCVRKRADLANHPPAAFNDAILSSERRFNRRAVSGQPIATHAESIMARVLLLLGAVLAGVAAVRPTAEAQSSDTTVQSTASIPPGTTVTLSQAADAGAARVVLTNRSSFATVATLSDSLRVMVPTGYAIDVIASTDLQRIRCPNDPASPDGCFSVSGAAELVFTFVVPPPRPTPPPSPPPPVPEGETVDIPPGETVVFDGPGLLTPNRRRGIAVTNQSARSASAVRQINSLTITAPNGVTLQAEVVYEGIGDRVEPCVRHPLRPHVARCRWFEARATNSFIRFTITTTATVPPMEEVPLSRGCTNVVLTWPQFMPAEWIAETIEPAAALAAIWRYSPPYERFIGFAPGAPADANDYTATLERLEPVFLCLRDSATLVRPTVAAP
jgi:hypothetical protein